MKLVSPFFFNSCIDFDEARIQELVFEDQRYFSSFIEDIHNQICGLDGGSVLSQDLKPLTLAKSVCLVTSFVPFELGTKELTTAALKRLEVVAREGERYLKAKQLLAAVQEFVNDCALELPQAIQMGKLSMASILKACAITFEEEDLSLPEKLLAQMKLTRELIGEKLYVLVNLRSYLQDEEMNALADACLAERLPVLLVESCERKLLPNERRLLIDRDFCEISFPENAEL